MHMVEERAPATLAESPSLDKALAAQAAGDLTDAQAILDAVLAADPASVAALAAKGSLLRAQGRPREALMALLEALSLAPDHSRARLDLALALREAGRRDEARTLYGLLVRDPNSPAEAWYGLAGLLLSEGHEPAAEICLHRTVALAPDHVHARQHLADMLARRFDLAGAVDLYHDILSISPANPAAHAGLGQALIGLGRLGEAEDQLERALVMDDANSYAHLGRARLNLLEGKFPGAWEDFHWRWAQMGLTRPSPPGTAWDGETELAGQTILLWTEQGLGEVIHLLRYVPLVASRGARVVLGVPKSLAPLAAGLDGVHAVVPSGGRIPDGIRIDFNASLTDLPDLFGTNLRNIPRAPYLRVPPGRRPAIASPAPSMLKVGLVWGALRGSSSVPFDQLMPLLSLPGIACFGLQTGQRARDCTELAHPALITDLSPTLSDYADLAGRIAEMDVVVSVDGAAAHLAGALDVPVLVMLPYAPDWRWMLNREDSPWYGSARLFRQDQPGDWLGVITRVMGALEDKVAAERLRRQNASEAHTGTKAAIRAFLATHLQAGDLLIDVGAGLGLHSREAAAHRAGNVKVLAMEARPAEAAILARSASASLDVVAEAIGANSAPVVVAKAPRCGRSVFALPGWVASSRRTVTLDDLLAQRPQLAKRRMVLRLGAKGVELDVLDGLSAKPAVVVFEHAKGGAVARRLTEAGYTLLRFPEAMAAGEVVAFSGETGPVLALAPGVETAAIYGDVNDPASPAALARAAASGARLAAEGVRELNAGRLNQAGQLFAKALAVDPGNVPANANLGGLLRRIGRTDAACACWRRALALGAGPAVRANLANALRELGHLHLAEDAFLQVLTAEPNNARFLFAFGLLERQRGRPREALALFERAEQLEPGTVPRRDFASALLKSGNLARGMAELAQRPRPVFPAVAAPEWDGGRLDARTILVRDEGDAIDTVMLARYIPQVARHGGLVSVECVPEMARLLAGLPGVEQVIARGDTLPTVEVQVDLLDVPRLIGTTSRGTPPRDVPYLHLPDGVEPHRFPEDHRLRVGLAWAGRPQDRSPPLSALIRLAGDPGISLFSLQRGPRAEDLVTTGARPFIEDLGRNCKDLADSAAYMASLDVIIATDSVEAHIAGAMGKPVWVLLPLGNDWRWVDGRDDSVWYPTMRVFRQSEDGTWSRTVSRVAEALAAMAAGKRRRG